MSLFFESARLLLDQLFGSSSPAEYEIGLCVGAPESDGSALNEPAGSGYDRVTITNDASMFTAAETLGDSSFKFTNEIIEFPTASGAWGIVTHWFIFDTTAGRLVSWGELDPPREVSDGDTLRINPGSLIITLT